MTPTKNDKKAFSLAIDAIHDLLEMYEVDVSDPDVQQNIVNCAVSLDNVYHGYFE